MDNNNNNLKTCIRCKISKKNMEFNSICFRKSVQHCIDCRNYIKQLRLSRPQRAKEEKQKLKELEQERIKDCTLEII